MKTTKLSAKGEVTYLENYTHRRYTPFPSLAEPCFTLPIMKSSTAST